MMQTYHQIARGDILLAVDQVSLSFGGVKAITDVSFDIRKGEIRAIIGRRIDLGRNLLGLGGILSLQLLTGGG